MVDYIFALVPKKPRFSKHVLDRASSICSDVAQIALASIVIPALMEKYDLTNLIIGGVATLFFWTFSLLLARLIS